MNGARDHFLTDAALPEDQDRDRGLGGPFAEGFDEAHRAGLADEILERHQARLALLEPVDFTLQAAQLQGVLDGNDDAFGGSGLDEEVLSAGLHGLDHRIDAAGRRQHDHGHIEATRPHVLEHFDAWRAGHDEIQDHHVRRHAGDELINRAVSAVSLRDSKAFALENGLDQSTLGRVVIDDENALRHVLAPHITAGRCAATRLVLRML